MPIIKSAIKRVRQQRKKAERNRAAANHMRSLVKNILLWTKSGEKQKAERTFPEAQKAIDMAAKKNLIHKNNAAHKKSQIAKAMEAAGIKTTEKVQASAPKKTPSKKSGKK